eukprot:SAG31_NODE_5693_length_2377_cov_1.625110_1_plen_237_part_00
MSLHGYSCTLRCAGQHGIARQPTVSRLFASRAPCVQQLLHVLLLVLSSVGYLLSPQLTPSVKGFSFKHQSWSCIISRPRTAIHSIAGCRAEFCGSVGNNTAMTPLSAMGILTVLLGCCGTPTAGSTYKFLPSHTCGSHTRMDPPIIFFGPQTGVKDGQQCAEYCEDEGAGAALYYAQDASVNPGYCECRTKRCAHENSLIHHDGSKPHHAEMGRDGGVYVINRRTRQTDGFNDKDL